MSLILWFLLFMAAPGADVRPYPAAPFPQREWFNTPENKPLRLEDLRGKVVLVNFWTYG